MSLKCFRANFKRAITVPKNNIALKAYKNFSTAVGTKDIDYVKELVRNSNNELYLTSLFTNQKSREALWFFISFYQEIAGSTSSTLSSPYSSHSSTFYSGGADQHSSAALLKLNWWKNTVNQIYKKDESFPQTPLTRGIYSAVHEYKITRTWLTRPIKTKLDQFNNPPLTHEKKLSVKEFESISENMYAGLFHIYFELLGVRNYHCDNAARLISKAYNIILLLREICKFEAGKNVASAHGSRGDAGVNDNSNIAMLEFLTSNNDNLGAGNIKDSKSGKSGNDIKRDDDLIYELASTAFTRLCGVKEVYLPHSPKQSYPAYLSMVPLLSWLEQLEKHNFNIRNKKLLLSSFSLPIKLWYSNRSLYKHNKL